MKKFRVAKCLVDGKINEYAIFTDGSRKKMIKTDRRYGKYFEVDNELNTDIKGLLRYSYSGRIKDAVDMIRNGNGDCISAEKTMIRIDRVLYFLDRQIGEELRQKSLKGWKNTKFGWAIECGYKNTFSGYSMINKRGEQISVFDKDKVPKVFNEKDEADKYAASLIEKSRYYAKQLADNVYNVTEEKEMDNVIDRIFDEIEKDTGTKFSIISDFVYDMLDGDYKLKSQECNLDKMGYRVVQCIKN